MSSSMGRIIPYIVENKKCLKPPTSYVQYIIWVFSIYICPQWGVTETIIFFQITEWWEKRNLSDTSPLRWGVCIPQPPVANPWLNKIYRLVLKHGWGLYKWSFSMGKIRWKNHQEGISSPVWPEGNPSVKFPRLDCGHRISVCCWSKLLFSNPKTTQLLTSVSPRINILILDHQVFFSNYLDHFAFYTLVKKTNRFVENASNWRSFS